MISDSATLLPIMLEQRFGSRWLQNWQGLEDVEARWLAIHLATEAANGRDLNGASILTGISATGRRQLPAIARSNRSITTLLTILRQASLLPPQADVRGTLLAEQSDKYPGTEASKAAQV